MQYGYDCNALLIKLCQTIYIAYENRVLTVKKLFYVFITT